MIDAYNEVGGNIIAVDEVPQERVNQYGVIDPVTAGDAGPLVVSTAMLEEYLLKQGREWERFAWLKGRVISTPTWASQAQFEAQSRALDDVVRPFVYRKYFDFNAIAALRQLHPLVCTHLQTKGHFEGHARQRLAGVREAALVGAHLLGQQVLVVRLA
jgi:hypothetical protein